MRGCRTPAAWSQPSRAWVRQRGLNLYTLDGKLGFGENDIAELFAYWSDLRKRKGCVAPDVQALDKRHSREQHAVRSARRRSRSRIRTSSSAFQAVNKSKLGMTCIAGGQARSLASTSSHRAVEHVGPGERAGGRGQGRRLLHRQSRCRLAAWRRARHAGLGEGARAAVEPDLDDLGKEMAQYIAFIERQGRRPAAAAAARARARSRSCCAGSTSRSASAACRTEDAAKQFVTEANAILARG